ncbi:SHOCT domain-containing protein [Actinophytocola sp. NPDC049390]|uniref:SHOCT domain-containing protein n=1 Tax=Actinophytocola sp. NPDC049390 TaxID=3363894 RepID=UPI00379863E6
MTWQENLRALDARLANGEIGAAEYRKTRDEILAEASSASQPVSFEPANEPGWQVTNPAEELDADTTLITSVDTAPPQHDPDAEATQVVSTDFVTASPSGSPTTAPSVSPTAAPGPAQLGPPGPPPQVRPVPIQGQEVFSQARSSGGTGRVLRFVIPVLILALVGAGVWWFALRDGTAPPAAQDDRQQQEQTTTTTAPATSAVPKAEDVAASMPVLPGAAKPESGTMTPEQAQRQKLLTPAYAKLLADGGVSELVYRKSAGDGYGYLLVAAPVEPSGQAAALVSATTDSLGQTGFKPVPGSDEPPVISRTDQFFRTYVTMYTSGDVWVQLNVSAPPDGEEATLGAEFGKVLRSVLEELPAR